MAILFARLQADVRSSCAAVHGTGVIQLTDLQAVIEVNHRKVGVLRAWSRSSSGLHSSGAS